ncbi:type II toxin-antitoxin system RelE/ParE family toxin [Nocardiopsis sp. Huas11]|uniref:type II toxin-antitoxin system RelE/ParE family toxin n=1 Tax=Nocardiopsis sp. Huas11 TaxID=2183912 RepID=UPI001F17CAA3|nr:type II toxin-antitoxin system RelE/ParE family toxin [Nocardiopsis sp. Huas11]
MWDIQMLEPVEEWYLKLAVGDPVAARLVANALDRLSRAGPLEGHPLVNDIRGSRTRHLKELRPGSAGRGPVRLLFVFGPSRQAVILVAGDTGDQGRRWYKEHVPIAEDRDLEYLRDQKDGREARTRDWREIRAEAERLNPWSASPEAEELAEADDARVEAEAMGYALAALRQESGLTQAQVAEGMGADQTLVSQIEHGQVDSLEHLRCYIGAIGGILELKVAQEPTRVTLGLAESGAGRAGG